MAVWFALVRMPFTPKACSFSCYNHRLAKGKAHSMLLMLYVYQITLTFTTAVRASTTYFLSNGAIDFGS